jgi:HlyD family secretion protein
VGRYLRLVLLLAAAGCGGKKDKGFAVQTAAITRRTIVVDAQATGVIEPINIVEVKSKASGLITKMTVETGSRVKPGDVLVQVDTRDVQNQFNQADANLKAADAKLEVSNSQRKRSDEMFKARVITAQEHEAAALDYENSKAAVVSAGANLDLAKQRLEDATVAAQVDGTIIEKDVSVGQVITSATGAFGGGTTLLKMANLNTVRIRALFNETDIGQVRPGQQATVIVDAYPDRRFQGGVEKIEPQAVIQQNVTMFPVLVTLANQEGLLKPGMNGQVSVLVDERDNVLAVPNDALKNPREVAATGAMLGLNPDTLQAEMRIQFGNRGGGDGGGAGAGGGGGRGARGGQGGQSGARATSQGEVAPATPAQQGQQGQQQSGGFQLPDVSDKDCAAVSAALKKKPAEKKKLDDLRDQMRAGSLDRAAAGAQMQQLYAAVGVDARVAGACRRKEMMASGGAPSPSPSPASAQKSGAQNGAKGLQLAAPEVGAIRVRTRPALVFVAEDNTYRPRIVTLGQGNFDYTEVVSGLKEGDRVALLASLALQAARQQQNDRFRQNTGVPGMQATPQAGRAATPAPAPRPAAPPPR